MFRLFADSVASCETRAYGTERTCATEAGSRKADDEADPLRTQNREAPRSHDLVRSGWRQALHRHRERAGKCAVNRTQAGAL